MRATVLTLLWLLFTSPLAQAADWLHWRTVGNATFNWGPFTLYNSQLLTPSGQYNGPHQDQVLLITYQRDIASDQLVEATREQWQELGILETTAQSQSWLEMLSALWPNVEKGTQLAFVFNNQQGQFWYRASPEQKSFTRLGSSQSADFSRSFLAIWLSPNTQYPKLRQQLIGGEK